VLLGFKGAGSVTVPVKTGLANGAFKSVTALTAALVATFVVLSIATVGAVTVPVKAAAPVNEGPSKGAFKAMELVKLVDKVELSPKADAI
jgi:hypothetical protein